MGLAQTFESGDAPDRAATLKVLRTHLRDTGTAPDIRHRGPADGGAIPVLEPLQPLIPGGELQRGTIVSVASRRQWQAPSYLELALAAGATAGGAWVGIIGYPDLGIAALSGLGADLSKVLLLDEPGEQWPKALAVMAGAVDLVLLYPPRRPTAEQLRRAASRIRTTDRQRGAVLVTSGPWDGAHLRLRADGATWSGLGDGTGHLTGRRVTVSAAGRGIGGERSIELWLPAADGGMQEYVPIEDSVTAPIKLEWPQLRAV